MSGYEMNTMQRVDREKDVMENGYFGKGEGVAALDLPYFHQVSDLRKAAENILGAKTASLMSDKDLDRWATDNFYIYCAYNDERCPGCRESNDQTILLIEKSAWNELLDEKKLFVLER